MFDDSYMAMETPLSVVREVRETWNKLRFDSASDIVKNHKLLQKMEYYANDWSTCACGQLDMRIPRAENGAPIDATLKCYGNVFFDILTELRDAAETINYNLDGNPWSDEDAEVYNLCLALVEDAKRQFEQIQMIEIEVLNREMAANA